MVRFHPLPLEYTLYSNDMPGRTNPHRKVLRSRQNWIRHKDGASADLSIVVWKGNTLPWTPETAKKHNKKADNTWTKVANSALKSGKSDASAIKIANSVLRDRLKKNMEKS